MVFSSLPFLFFFLPAALGLYYLAPRSWRNGELFLVSLVFYAWGEPVYVLLMLFSTVLDYTNGRLVQRYKDQGRLRAAKAAVAWAVVLNLGILGFFKYADLFIGTFNSLAGTAIPLLEIPLPIGISFYTFQTMSYTIDVYRGDARMQPNIISFGAYVAMFPQLIAGPIVRYQDVDQQMDHREMNWELFSQGVERFLTGMVKKVLLANGIGLLWDTVAAAPQLSMLSAWLGILAFGFQIYFDFSGYSDMAIGLGKMLGFRLPENFDHPYMSSSVAVFWRRWHMTLGTWFREYLYIPLGGNRRGKARTILNLAIVWMATGIWHGASWNFLLWGAWFGLLLILERFVWGKALERHPAWGHIYTLLALAVSWVFFSFPSLPEMGRYLASMAGAGGLADNLGLYSLLSYGPMLAVMALAATPWLGQGLAALKARGAWGRTVVLGVYLAASVVVLASLVDASYNPFLYFRF